MTSIRNGQNSSREYPNWRHRPHIEVKRHKVVCGGNTIMASGEARKGCDTACSALRARIFPLAALVVVLDLGQGAKNHRQQTGQPIFRNIIGRTASEASPRASYRARRERKKGPSRSLRPDGSQ